MVYTKRAVDVFAPTDSGGTPRMIIPEEAQTWGTEVEQFFGSADGLPYGTKFLKSTGSEGGELRLEKPETGSTLAADVVVDLNSDRVRIFEGGGTLRGAYIPLDEAAAGVGSRLAFDGFTRQGITSPAVLTNYQKMSQRMDLRDWAGIDYTGANDSASAVQAAVNHATATGDRLHFPPGDIVLGSPINLNGQVSMIGVDAPGVRDDRLSTWFHFAHTGRGLYTEATSGSFTIDNIGMFRQQPTPGPGWAPTVADYDLWFQGQDVILNNIMHHGTYRGVTLNGTAGGVGSGRLTINNWRGQCFKEALVIVSAYDVCRVNNWHQWPYWSQNEHVRAFQYANLDAITSLRNDNPIFMSVFSIWHRAGLVLGYFAGDAPNRPAGVTSKAKFIGVDMDLGAVGVEVAANASGTTAHFVAFSAQGHDSSASSPTRGVHDKSTTGSSLRFEGVYLTGMGAELVKIEGSGGFVSLEGVKTGSFNLTSGGYSAFNVAGGTLAIEGAVEPSVSLTYTGAGIIKLPVNGYDPATFNGAVTTNAAITANAAINMNPGATTAWALNGAGNTVTIANGANTSLPAGSGVVMLIDNSSGDTGLFVCGGGTVALISSTLGNFVSGTTPAAGKISLGFSTTYRIYNNFGSSRTLSVVAISGRNSV